MKTFFHATIGHFTWKKWNNSSCGRLNPVLPAGLVHRHFHTALSKQRFQLGGPHSTGRKTSCFISFFVCLFLFMAAMLCRLKKKSSKMCAVVLSSWKKHILFNLVCVLIFSHSDGSQLYFRLFFHSLISWDVWSFGSWYNIPIVIPAVGQHFPRQNLKFCVLFYVRCSAGHNESSTAKKTTTKNNNNNNNKQTKNIMLQKIS